MDIACRHQKRTVSGKPTTSDSTGSWPCCCTRHCEPLEHEYPPPPAPGRSAASTCHASPGHAVLQRCAAHRPDSATRAKGFSGRLHAGVSPAGGQSQKAQWRAANAFQVCRPPPSPPVRQASARRNCGISHPAHRWRHLLPRGRRPATHDPVDGAARSQAAHLPPACPALPAPLRRGRGVAAQLLPHHLPGNLRTSPAPPAPYSVAGPASAFSSSAPAHPASGRLLALSCDVVVQALLPLQRGLGGTLFLALGKASAQACSSNACRAASSSSTSAGASSSGTSTTASEPSDRAELPLGSSPTSSLGMKRAHRDGFRRMRRHHRLRSRSGLRPRRRTVLRISFCCASTSDSRIGPATQVFTQGFGSTRRHVRQEALAQLWQHPLRAR